MWKNLIVFLLLSAAAEAHSRVEFLNTEAAIDQEYCRTEFPRKAKECYPPRYRQVSLVYLPDELGAVVAKHIGLAYGLGYYQDLKLEDLFHGHMIFRGPRDQYENPEELFGDLSVILYHSAEFQERWSEEGRRGLDLAQRTPRSFVGWPDGSAQKAIDLTKPGQKLKSYALAGTIYTEELVEANPHLSAHKFTNFGGHQNLNVKICRGEECRTCEVQSMMLALPEAGGRFTGPRGERYELYFRCLGKASH